MAVRAEILRSGYARVLARLFRIAAKQGLKIPRGAAAEVFLLSNAKMRVLKSSITRIIPKDAPATPA